jgi:hypothetical protein
LWGMFLKSSEHAISSPVSYTPPGRVFLHRNCMSTPLTSGLEWAFCLFQFFPHCQQKTANPTGSQLQK